MTVACSKAGCTNSRFLNPRTGRRISLCHIHRQERMARDTERRKRKRQLQQCMSCARTALPDGIYCFEHRQSHAKRMRSRRDGLRVQGRCVECGASVCQTSRNTLSTRCPTHVQQQRDYTESISHMQPSKRRHLSAYCGICGVFRVTSSQTRFCACCRQVRQQCVEYRWHKHLQEHMNRCALPCTLSTFGGRQAMGTRHCAEERLMFVDMAWLLDDRVIVAECDEDAHCKETPHCELSRMENMQFAVDHERVVPLVVLRFNPHDRMHKIHADFAKRVQFMWSRVLHYLQCDADQLPPFDRITVEYFNYPRHSPHVRCTLQSPRFKVTVHDPSMHK